MLRTRTCLLLAALVACAVAMPTLKMRQFADEEYDFVFSKWQSQHGKEYFGAAEHALRREVFADNMDFVSAHQERFEAGEETYEVELNKFADLTSAEFKELYLGFVAMPNRTLDVEVLAESNADSVDWRSKGAVTPVKNQGQCGSCWSFSATGSMEGRYQISKGKLISLSEQQLVDCSKSQGNMGCNGGLMDYAFTYVKSNGGIDTEADYAYTAKDGTCDTTKAAKHAIAIAGYKDVTPNSEAQLAAAVAQGPVSVAIEADQSGFQMYKSGVFSGTCGTQLDHGVLAVGYGSEASGIFHKQKAYWIVKNSWGATWGDQGYIKLAKDISSSHGQCGIAMQPSYPTL